MSPEPAPTTEDRLLGGRVLLRQPVHGLRAAIDPVFLAAAVTAGPRDRCCELGTGSGAAALCLAARVASCRILGIELQPALAALAADNALANGVADRLAIRCADLADLPREPAFDHVFANPPYDVAGRGTLPPDAARATATVEGAVPLDRWIETAASLLRPRGTVTLIHRADRLAAALRALSHGFGTILVFPLFPKRGRPATRIILTARRGSDAPLSLAPGMVLHRDDGAYTEEAEAVLRHGQPLPSGP